MFIDEKQSAMSRDNRQLLWRKKQSGGWDGWIIDKAVEEGKKRV